jgi:hypothetical protein
MFMDITESIIDTKISLAKPTKRYIGSKSKHEIIYKYKQYIHKQFTIHRIYTRAAVVSELAKAMKITPELQNQINQLDNQIANIVLAAERAVCPKQHESEWSTVIHHQSQLCKYWAIVTKGVKNKINTTSTSNEKIFSNLPKDMQTEIIEVTNDHHPTKIRLECYSQLRLATRYHKKLLCTHIELRRQSLLSLKEIRNSEGNLWQRKS